MRQRIKKSICTIFWAIKIAFTIDKATFLCWLIFTGVLSILPAFSLEVLQQVLEDIAAPEFDLHFVIFKISLLGIIMVAIGLSSRLNTDLLYMVMYDSYCLGMMERIIDFTRTVDVEALMDKSLRDEYTAATLRVGALNDFLSAFCALVGKAITITSLLIFIFRISIFVFILSLLFCFFAVVVNLKLTRNIRIDIKEMRPLESQCDYFEKLPLQDGVAKEIRLFGMQKAVLHQWKKALLAITNINLERERRSESHSLFISIVFYISFSLIMLTSIFQIRTGIVRASAAVAIFNYGFQMFAALQMFSKIIIKVDNGLFSLERQKALFESTSTELHTECGQPDTKHDGLVFELNNVSYTYPNGKNAVDEITFSIREGEIVALVGENGGGKTTIINLLLGILTPQKGDMYFCGLKYGTFDQSLLHSNIGVFFQEYSLFHKTIRENVGFGDIRYIDDRNRVHEALQCGDAHTFVNKLPLKEDTYVGKRVEKSGVEFSGGEKQKLGISRANMSNKEILFFDEPSAMLDPLAELRQFNQIKEKLNGRTAILVSHRMGFTKEATKVIVVHQGHVVGCGNHKTLMATCPQYKIMYDAQSKWYEEETVSEIS